MADNRKTLLICDADLNHLGTVRRSYFVKFIDPSKEYKVAYLTPSQSESGKRESGIFKLKGKDLTENQILQLLLSETL